jgi:hypothetical protein
MNKDRKGEEMATFQDATPASAYGDMAEHERTYQGFILTIKISTAVVAATLLLMYFFLAR